MESRNILLIVICICAFLVLIFGIGFIWSLPEKEGREAERPQDDENGSGIDIFEHVRDGSDLPGLEPTEEPSDSMTIVYGEQEDETETPAEDDKEKEESGAGEENEKTDETEKEGDYEKKTVIIRTPEEEKPEYPKTYIVKPQPTPVPQPTPAPKRLVTEFEYWIQAGSFESRNRADTLNERLAEHGFKGLIKTTVSEEGITLYRVRIGPYQNKKEAEKFLEWLKVLDGMKGSYISQVKVQKWVN
jgi:cell division protein FtsN